MKSPIRAVFCSVHNVVLAAVMRAALAPHAKLLMMWKPAFKATVAATLCLLMTLLPIQANTQMLQNFESAAEGGLFGTLPSIPKTPTQLQHYLVMRGMAAVLGDTLPIKLDAKNTFPTVEDSTLPGGVFHGKPLELTAENLTKPLPAGDWTIAAVAFCQEYSIHQPGAGTAYKIGPLQGTKAELIATFLWRGVLAGKSPNELQLVEWAIESGVPYFKMPKPYQADVDQLIPSYKDQLQGGWIDQPEAKYYSIVTQPSEYLKAVPIPGMGIASKLMVHAMPTPPPTFSDFLKKVKMGRAGTFYDDAKALSEKFTKPYTDEQQRARDVYEGQGSKSPPVPAQNGPWTVKANGVYLRFIVHGGNLQSDNELQIRVTPSPQPVTPLAATTTQQMTLLGLMGVSLAGPGFAVAGRTVTALEAVELAGVVLSGAEIAFAVGFGAQALIIVLPIVLSKLRQPASPPIVLDPVVSVPKEKEWSNVGICSESRWQYLQDQVDNICKPVPGICRPRESCKNMLDKLATFNNCGVARTNINNECYPAPQKDPVEEARRKSHQKEAARMKIEADRCRGLLPTCVLP